MNKPSLAPYSYFLFIYRICHNANYPTILNIHIFDMLRFTYAESVRVPCTIHSRCILRSCPYLISFIIHGESFNVFYNIPFWDNVATLLYTKLNVDMYTVQSEFCALGQKFPSVKLWELIDCSGQINVFFSYLSLKGPHYHYSGRK